MEGGVFRCLLACQQAYLMLDDCGKYRTALYLMVHSTVSGGKYLYCMYTLYCVQYIGSKKAFCLRASHCCCPG